MKTLIKLFLFVFIFLSTINYQPVTLFAVLKDNLDEVVAYPNPVRFSRGESLVTFDNLTNNIVLRIIKVNGDLVRELTVNGSNGIIVWNVTNDHGQRLGAGVYLYLITNEHGQKAKGKLAIIR